MDGKKERQERDAVDAVAKRLKKKYPDLKGSHVEQIVESQYARLKNAPLRDYIAVLVEHGSKDVLGKEDKSGKRHKD
jgi:hypothetical protein